jgi:hypothetical protein
MARRIDGRRIADAVEAGVSDGAYPGAVILVGLAGEGIYHQAFGRRSLEPNDGPMRGAARRRGCPLSCVRAR